jgi:flagellar hook-length control protein FliK
MATQPSLSNALLSIGGLNSGSSLSGLSSGLSGLSSLGTQSGLSGITSTGSTFYQQLSEWSSIQQSGGELPAEAVAWLKTASYQASMSQQSGWMATGSEIDGGGGNFLPLSLTSFDESLAALQGQWQSLQGQTGLDWTRPIMGASDALDIESLMEQVLSQNGLATQSGLSTSGFEVTDWSSQMQRFLEQAQQAMQAMSERLETDQSAQGGGDQSEADLRASTLLESLTTLLDELDLLKDQIQNELAASDLVAETNSDQTSSYTAGLDAFLNTQLPVITDDSDLAETASLSLTQDSASVKEQITQWMDKVSEWAESARQSLQTTGNESLANDPSDQWVDMTVSAQPVSGKNVENLIAPTFPQMKDALSEVSMDSAIEDNLTEPVSPLTSAESESGEPWISTGRPDLSTVSSSRGQGDALATSAAVRPISSDSDASTLSASMTELVTDEAGDDLLKSTTVSINGESDGASKTNANRVDLQTVNANKAQLDAQQPTSDVDASGLDDVSAPKEASRTQTESSLASLSSSTQWAQRGTSQVTMNMPAGMAPGQAGWSEALSERIVWAGNQRLQTATLQLDPPELGALQVKLHVSVDQQVSVSFSSPHAHVRDAVEQSVPRLREMLAEQGLSLGEAQVGDQGADRSQAQSEGRNSGRGYGQADSGLEGDDLTDESATRVSGGSVSLVDYYA